jgi:hypothetical protein
MSNISMSFSSVVGVGSWLNFFVVADVVTCFKIVST